MEMELPLLALTVLPRLRLSALQFSSQSNRSVSEVQALTAKFQGLGR